MPFKSSLLFIAFVTSISQAQISKEKTAEICKLSYLEAFKALESLGIKGDKNKRLYLEQMCDARSTNKEAPENKTTIVKDSSASMNSAMSTTKENSKTPSAQSTLKASDKATDTSSAPSKPESFAEEKGVGTENISAQKSLASKKEPLIPNSNSYSDFVSVCCTEVPYKFESYCRNLGAQSVLISLDEKLLTQMRWNRYINASTNLKTSSGLHL